MRRAPPPDTLSAIERKTLHKHPPYRFGSRTAPLVSLSLIRRCLTKGRKSVCFSLTCLIVFSVCVRVWCFKGRCLQCAWWHLPPRPPGSLLTLTTDSGVSRWFTAQTDFPSTLLSFENSEGWNSGGKVKPPLCLGGIVRDLCILFSFFFFPCLARVAGALCFLVVKLKKKKKSVMDIDFLVAGPQRG